MDEEYFDDEIKSSRTKQVVEAALFMAPGSLSIDELVKISKSNLAEVRVAVNQLMHDYMERDSAIEIIDEPQGVRMAVRKHLQDEVSSLAAVPEVHKGAMMTLAFIAYKQPVKQSDVIRYRNTKAYDHIALLEEKGFIRREKKKTTYLIYTTRKFQDYFGDVKAQSKEETAKKFAEHASEFEDSGATECENDSAELKEAEETDKEAEMLKTIDGIKDKIMHEEEAQIKSENAENKN